MRDGLARTSNSSLLGLIVSYEIIKLCANGPWLQNLTFSGTCKWILNIQNLKKVFLALVPATFLISCKHSCLCKHFQIFIISPFLSVSMYIWIYLNLFICLSIYLSIVYLSTYLYIYISIYLLACLPACMHACLSVCLFVCLSRSLSRINLCLSANLYISIYFSLPTYLRFSVPPHSISCE